MYLIYRCLLLLSFLAIKLTDNKFFLQVREVKAEIIIAGIFCDELSAGI
jgi:hypothetical protein